MYKKYSFLLLVLLFVSIRLLFAVPAVPWAVEKIQPDGTKISVYLKGDEKVHWMESADGYTLMYDAQKFVVYAQTDGQGNLTPSNIRLGSGAKFAANIVKGLRYSKAQINTMMQIWKMTDDAVIQRTSTGQINILCILAEFSDQAFVKTLAEFDDLMNQEGYNVNESKGSVRDYYLENSYGLLDLQVTVIEQPVPLTKSAAYYEQYRREFANEVVDLAASLALVDFSQFATNGQVESFHIIFAGCGDEAIVNGEQIWSHAGPLGVTKDGVILSHYSCSPEFNNPGGDITNIGIIVHEMGHGFGSPLCSA